jgi:preprotein translocase subunit YajC
VDRFAAFCQTSVLAMVDPGAARGRARREPPDGPGAPPALDTIANRPEAWSRARSWTHRDMKDTALGWFDASPLLAMGTPSDGAVSPLIQLIPFALILTIFYVVILLPMRRRQKKVREFLDSLKVGDRIVTSGGIYGLITKLGDKSVQMQIADKVRVDVARSAIVGYQGQDPVVPEPGNS